MLVHHADSKGDGLLGVLDLHRLAVEENLALVGVVHAVQAVHQS